MFLKKKKNKKQNKRAKPNFSVASTQILACISDEYVETTIKVEVRTITMPSLSYEANHISTDRVYFYDHMACLLSFYLLSLEERTL